MRPPITGSSGHGKPLIALALALLGCGAVSGCGSGGAHADSASSAASNAAATSTSSSGYVPRKFGDYDNDDYYNDSSHSDADNDDQKPTDRDNDSDNPTGSYYDSDDNPIRFYGRPASAADRRLITALVRRYYAAAAAGDGSTACEMMTAPIVNSIPHTVGGPAGPPYLRGKTCPLILSKIFKQNHEQLSTYNALMHVDGVRRSGDQALLIMRFKGLPARDIEVVHEHGTWKMDALLDDELP